MMNEFTRTLLEFTNSRDCSKNWYRAVCLFIESQTMSLKMQYFWMFVTYCLLFALGLFIGTIAKGQTTAPAEQPRITFDFSADKSQPPPVLGWETKSPDSVTHLAVNQSERSNEFNRAKALKAGYEYLPVAKGWNNLTTGTYFIVVKGGKARIVLNGTREFTLLLIREEGWTVAILNRNVPREDAIAWYNEHGWPLGDKDDAILGYQINVMGFKQTGRRPTTRLAE